MKTYTLSILSLWSWLLYNLLIDCLQKPLQSCLSSHLIWPLLRLLSHFCILDNNFLKKKKENNFIIRIHHKSFLNECWEVLLALLTFVVWWVCMSGLLCALQVSTHIYFFWVCENSLIHELHLKGVQFAVKLKKKYFIGNFFFFF